MARKKKRSVKTNNRSLVGASLEVRARGGSRRTKTINNNRGSSGTQCWSGATLKNISPFIWCQKPSTRNVSHTLPPGFLPPPLLCSLQVIQKKRGEKTEVRAAARDAALR